MFKKNLKRSSKSVVRRNATIFAALSDETRLTLLIKLGTGEPQSIQQLTIDLPVTRQAVTKHLRVLESAMLVSQTSHGRERRFVAQQSGIEQAQAALRMISQQWDDALARLKAFAEEKQ